MPRVSACGSARPQSRRPVARGSDGCDQHGIAQEFNPRFNISPLVYMLISFTCFGATNRTSAWRPLGDATLDDSALRLEPRRQAQLCFRVPMPVFSTEPGTLRGDSEIQPAWRSK